MMKMKLKCENKKMQRELSEKKNKKKKKYFVRTLNSLSLSLSLFCFLTIKRADECAGKEWFCKNFFSKTLAAIVEMCVYVRERKKMKG